MITFILIDRANYGRLKPVMRACVAAGLDVTAICGGSMVLPRFKRVVDTVRADGFNVIDEVYCEIEGSVDASMAGSVGLAVAGFSQALHRHRPDLAVMIGDRYEALGAATAAAALRIPILHLQGGEKSGTLDDKWRRSITGMADYHWPATEKAAWTVRQTAGRGTVLGVGCPSTDLMANLDNTPGDYILAAYHPDTCHPETAAQEVAEVLEALKGRRVVMLWPNIDPGSYGVERILREHPEIERRTNFEPEEFYKLMAGARCLVGNSSSFVRDSALLGIPAIIVGTRQLGREAAGNTFWVPAEAEVIRGVLGKLPLRCERSTLFGDGKVSERIAGAIVALTRKGKAA